MKYHFATVDDAWAFAQAVAVQGKSRVVDYGVDQFRMVDRYYVEVEDTNETQNIE